MLKQDKYSALKSRVARHFNHPENQIRLWVVVKRVNQTVRPDVHVPENDPTLSPPNFALFYPIPNFYRSC